LADGIQGIAIVQVPEPSLALTAALLALSFDARRRRYRA
jgi:hypothetical protein